MKTNKLGLRKRHVFNRIIQFHFKSRSEYNFCDGLMKEIKKNERFHGSH